MYTTYITCHFQVRQCTKSTNAKSTDNYGRHGPNNYTEKSNVRSRYTLALKVSKKQYVSSPLTGGGGGGWFCVEEQCTRTGITMARSSKPVAVAQCIAIIIVSLFSRGSMALCATVQSQKAVSAYCISEQILHFGFA